MKRVHLVPLIKEKGIGNEELRNILIALSSGLELNLETFTPFCHRTAEYLVANYGWYKLPPSVHKMLEHGGQVAAKLELASNWSVLGRSTGNPK